MPTSPESEDVRSGRVPDQKFVLDLAHSLRAVPLGRLCGYVAGYGVCVLSVTLPGVWLYDAFLSANVWAVVGVLVLVFVNLRFLRELDASRRVYFAALRGREVCDCGRHVRPVSPGP